MRSLPILAILLPALAAAAQDPTADPEVPTPGPDMPSTGALSEEEFKRLHELKPSDDTVPLSGAEIEIGAAKAYLSLPKGEPPFPAVLVIHEWYGLNRNIKLWTDRLAVHGYAALAIDLYGGVVATTADTANATMKAVNEDEALATLLAAHEFLASDARVKAKKRASIGWCFGGTWSLRLALAAKDLDAAVIYYGRLVNDADRLRSIHARILGVFGDRDRSIPRESVDAFATAASKAGVSCEIHRYDADHAFANPSNPRYDEESAAAAWAQVSRFLDQNLRSTTKPQRDPKR